MLRGGCSAINSCLVGPLPCTFRGATGDLSLWVLDDWHPRVVQPDSPLTQSGQRREGEGCQESRAFRQQPREEKTRPHRGPWLWESTRETNSMEVSLPMTIQFCGRCAWLRAMPVAPGENPARSPSRTHSLTCRTMQNENPCPCFREDEEFRNSNARALNTEHL